MKGQLSGEVAGGTHRAAAYVRMSTGRQDQSIGQQLDYIGRYAAASACAVVRIYRDEGKSGLSADRRQGLRQLLADVSSGKPGFDLVLVYDVSRWGRFQDVDESAYYEHLCSRNGVRVVYCAEHFANDGSPLAHIIKSIKRTMAAEYSRELSVRTFDAQAFLLAQGYKPGGAAGYGLRRLSVRADGSVRRLLQDGERKCHPTDRVVLTPGPDAEVRTVRLIFQLYIEQKLNYRAVARFLNDGGIRALGGQCWSEARVKAVLSNEKYCGNLLYNRTSARLGARRRRNDPDHWMRSESTHACIVSPDVFTMAQRLHGMLCGTDVQGTLERLRAVYARNGVLSYRLIDAERGMPHVAMIKKMFGSLDHAYALAMAPAENDAPCFRPARLSELRRQLSTAAWRCIIQAGHQVSAGDSPTELLIDAGVSLRIAVAGRREKMGRSGWLLPALASNSDFVLCGLLDERGRTVCGYALIDAAHAARSHRWMPAGCPPLRGIIYSKALNFLFGMGSAEGIGPVPSEMVTATIAMPPADSRMNKIE